VHCTWSVKVRLHAHAIYRARARVVQRMVQVRLIAIEMRSIALTKTNFPKTLNNLKNSITLFFSNLYKRPGAGAISPRALERQGDTRALLSNNEPRRGLRQGTSIKECLRPPRNRCACRRRTLYKTITTLSNGYLGSRIDEERSEMRYLV
jgi:hypothetical protein